MPVKLDARSLKVARGGGNDVSHNYRAIIHQERHVHFGNIISLLLLLLGFSVIPSPYRVFYRLNTKLLTYLPALLPVQHQVPYLLKDFSFDVILQG